MKLTRRRMRAFVRQFLSFVGRLNIVNNVRIIAIVKRIFRKEK